MGTTQIVNKKELEKGGTFLMLLSSLLLMYSFGTYLSALGRWVYLPWMPLACLIIGAFLHFKYKGATQQ